MKIAIIAQMPARGYSGGRYCAFIMAQCLAMTANQVYLITDTVPQFLNDFTDWEKAADIHYVLTRGFILKEKLGEDFDFVIMVPVISPDYIFISNFRKIHDILGGTLVVLNFETPNWYNLFVPNGRKLDSLLPVRQLLWERGGIVLSSAEESVKYAKEYYGESERITYAVWNPAINSIAADKSASVKKEKRILSMVRLKDKHKGGEDVLKLLAQPLEGYTVVLVAGAGKVNREYWRKLKYLSKKYGFSLEIKKKLSDENKFREMRKAEILLFPTKFEGYGYPPVEAQYCNTYCITYDLPVLREISQDRIVYCAYGNVDDMKQSISKILGKKLSYNAEQKEKVMEIGNCLYRAEKINQLLLFWKEKNAVKNIGETVRKPEMM